MSVTRLLVPGTSLSRGFVVVPPDASRHARVARVRPGETVELLDLDGAVGVGVLEGWEGSSCRVRVDAVERERGEPPASMALALAVLHTAAFDWAVEKCTELGVTAIMPVLCERVQGGSTPARRVERWARIAEAAVAQCGRTRCPALLPPRTLERTVQEAAGFRLFADPDAVGGEAYPAAAGFTVLVGPEGGFTDGELASIREAGFVGLGLGNRVLRAETAAVAALVAVQVRAGWLR